LPKDGCVSGQESIKIDFGLLTGNERQLSNGEVPLGVARINFVDEFRRYGKDRGVHRWKHV